MFSKVLIIFLYLSFIKAHFFWIKPEKLREPNLFKILCITGDQFPISTYAITKERIAEIATAPEKALISIEKFVRKEKISWLTLKLQQERPVLLGMRLAERQLTLSREELEEYLAHIAQSKLFDKIEKKKIYRERYTKFAYTLLGKTPSKPLRTNFELELTPFVQDNRIYLQLLFKGKPLKNHPLLVGNPSEVQTFLTDEKGRVEIPLQWKGPVQATTVFLKEANSSQFDLLSRWVSIVFHLP